MASYGSTDREADVKDGDGRVQEIEVEVLQRAFRDSGMSKAAVARELGWTRGPKNGVGDTSRFARAIGLAPWSRLIRGECRYCATTRYERAVMIVQAMGLEPADYGL